MPQVSRDVFVRIFATDNGGGQDGIGRCQTSCDSKTGQKVEARNESVDESGRYEPALEEGIGKGFSRGK
jgi:hypothetical protein